MHNQPTDINVAFTPNIMHRIINDDSMGRSCPVRWWQRNDRITSLYSFKTGKYLKWDGIGADINHKSYL
ncbi:hypothetical protein F4X73_03585 [Candidatus Poribacteria bacterium]|nr:hypothetical protein [Candidatus Poribacteria bacterium]MYB63750.1 hypothetical protein [Candidatus Poribacteria bacterium]MYF57380.1 hypothetical protein [Candidatus Poribacteria bacterium]